jgi:hypothetical protein
MLQATAAESERRDEVLHAIRCAVSQNQRIVLPKFDPQVSIPSEMALQSVGVEPNDFGGTVAEYRYQFEGEDDLLHLIVTKRDGAAISVTDAREVCTFLLENLSSSMIWLKPGAVSQHFYLAQDVLL